MSRGGVPRGGHDVPSAPVTASSAPREPSCLSCHVLLVTINQDADHRPSCGSGLVNLTRTHLSLSPSPDL